MSLALYRKYRSKSFKDVVGQDHITKTLQKSVDNNTFSHAYLLTGLRGVGKTSIARIFAAYVNGISYEETERNPDIIEIDAASNRKIDEIRELREKVNIAPSGLSYKVYIIDEVHMLTREAFNALLKTLEEPPKHCILVLATTDYHKLPETIVSRCVRFSFRSIGNDDIVSHLEKIAANEKIKIEKEALKTIANNSSGSLRDAIVILDQSRNVSDKITSSDVELLLGLTNNKNIIDLFDSFLSDDPKAIISQVETIRNTGANPEQVISQFARLLRSKIAGGDTNRFLLDLLSELMGLDNFSDKWLALEVCLLKHTSLSDVKEVVSNQIQKELPKPAEKETNDDIPSKQTASLTDNDLDLWQKVLDELKTTNSTLYGVARMAEPSFNEDTLELKLKFNFHKKQLDIKRNQLKIIEIISRHNTKITSITTFAVKDNESNEESQQYDSTKDISNISNVFGSAEMLE